MNNIRRTEKVENYNTAQNLVPEISVIIRASVAIIWMNSGCRAQVQGSGSKKEFKIAHRISQIVFRRVREWNEESQCSWDGWDCSEKCVKTVKLKPTHKNWHTWTTKTTLIGILLRRMPFDAWWRAKNWLEKMAFNPSDPASAPGQFGWGDTGTRSSIPSEPPQWEEGQDGKKLSGVATHWYATRSRWKL